MFKKVSTGRALFLGAIAGMSLLIFSYALSAEAVSGINREIPFSGVLKSSPSGRPVDGTRDMVFRIYDVPTGGTALWVGNYTAGNGNAVSVDDGNFSVMLGSGTGNEMTLDFIDDTYYLGVTVGTDSEMSPRERLGASPYAFNADMLDGLHASDFYKKGSPVSVSEDTTDSLLSVTQLGSGNFVSFLDGTDTEVFSVLSTGEVVGTKYQSTLDDVNTFLGWFDVQGSQPSSFVSGITAGESITVADGSGIAFGNGAGVFMSQDASVVSGVADLVLSGIGPEEVGYVNITTPGGLWLTANNFDNCSSGCEPAFRLNETGSAELSNLSYGDSGERYLRLNFTDGVEVTTGGLNIVEGDLALSAGNARLEDGTLTVDNLAPDSGTISLEVDTSGTLIPSVSDERLKENIRAIDGALEMVLDLRGVRYEWRDTERFGTKTEVGFVAQEVEEVLPEVVRDTGEYLSVNTKNVVAVVVEAMKELYREVETYFARTERLEREVELLRAEIASLREGRVGGVPDVEPEVSEEEPVLENPETNEPEDAKVPVEEENGEEEVSEPAPEIEETYVE